MECVGIISKKSIISMAFRIFSTRKGNVHRSSEGAEMEPALWLQHPYKKNKKEVNGLIPVAVY